LTSISPATGVQGTGVPVSLTGANFVSGATVAVGNPGITVSGVTVVSATQINATFTIAANTAVGSANVTVTISGSTSNGVGFTVNCAAASTCTTSWNVTAGNVLMVMFYDAVGDPGGNISDVQGNVYTDLAYIGNYDAGLTLYGATLGAGGAPACR
jgi:hypothetical protein